MRDVRLWAVAIILGVILVYLVGPLTGLAFPLDFLYRGKDVQVQISGLLELLIFVVVIRFLLGSKTAKKLLKDLFSKKPARSSKK